MNDRLGLEIPPEVLEALADAISERLLPTVRPPASTEAWPEWMAIETAARYLDVSPQRLRKLVSTRQIPFHQEAKGCRVLFRRGDLDEWMSGFRVPVRNSHRPTG